MKKYYVVYDMTPYDERGENYIQVGIATQNHKMIIGEEHYDPDSPDYKPENKDIDQSEEINNDDGKVDPYDDDDYEKHEHDRDEEIEDHNADMDEDVVDPEEDGNNTGFIVGGTVFALLAIGIAVYFCRNKCKEDAYMSKAYSQVDDGLVINSGI